MGKKSGSEMEPEAFRHHGRAALDWLIDYRARVAELPVQTQIAPGAFREQLPPSPPKEGEDFAALLADMERLVLPAITHWQSPNFFAYFPANVSASSILGELLSAGLGVQGMLWATSPACTELESHVLDWLVELLALPSEFLSSGPGGAVIQDSASSATLCALIAARERAVRTMAPAGADPELHRADVQARLRIYASDQVHSSLEKAAMIAGLGRAGVVTLETDDAGAIQTAALADQLSRDIKSGKIPCFIQATHGTTGVNAFDSIPAMYATLSEQGLRQQMWIHVDAAMSGSAGLCPEFRTLFTGLDLVDSYTFNPHKWMMTNFDCNCLFLRDRAALISAMAIDPEYLANAASSSGDVIDYRDWQVPLGRRFRALKLWFVIRSFGRAGLQAVIRRHVNLAGQLADKIAAHPRLQLFRQPDLNLVCFDHTGGPTASRALLEQINASGRAYLSHCTFRGRYLVRICVGQTHTTQEHVDQLWQLICKTAEQID